jgi:proteasome lid subunit RPN8/RPN11
VVQVFLELSLTHLQAMQAHAQRSYPNECCGLLTGRLNATAKQVTAIHPMENSWSPDVAQELGDDPNIHQTRRYWIDPAEMLAVWRTARTQGLDMIGIYHSHPDHPSVPSECDRRLAWPQYSYLIFSVRQGTMHSYESWQLDEQHHFQPELIRLIE